MSATSTDVVEWARALDLADTASVWQEVQRATSTVASVLDELALLATQVAQSPEDDLLADTRRAFELIDGVGERLLQVARAALEHDRGAR